MFFGIVQGPNKINFISFWANVLYVLTQKMSTLPAASTDVEGKTFRGKMNVQNN